MLEVRTVSVTIDQSVILDGLTLDVPDGHVVAVLGPSGSGKTTLLRAIAGLVDIASGEIAWNGDSILGVPPHRRDFGLMFQGYALFPHLDVAGNVGFGLEMTGEDGVAAAVSEALRWVGMDGFQNRTIDSLSGGEKQRVAMARTLAPNPRLVMLDEPVGALDRNLRQRLVADTRQTLVERGVTAIVVTHDREEAVTLSDSMALMRQGRIVQAGSLDEILANPADPWVSEFLG
jgi:ABC-type Fe3+/spermidine/putrescine transport system ATPase subunit